MRVQGSHSGVFCVRATKARTHCPQCDSMDEESQVPVVREILILVSQIFVSLLLSHTGVKIMNMVPLFLFCVTLHS